MRKSTLFSAVCSLALAPCVAMADDGTSLKTAIEDTKTLFSSLVRYEGVDQTGFDETASALTYRLRVGFETGSLFDTKLLVEFDHVDDFIDDYNSTINGKTEYPVVADPATTELNRFQLTNTALPDTSVTLGRQVINFDDQRFVGSVGWRQNDQTVDALRVTNTSLGSVKIDAVYLNQINRIFGEESAAGRWGGDTYLLNASAPTPVGKITGFGYMIDVEELGGVPSSQTFGARLAGSEDIADGKINYVASYATQSDYGSSNLDYSAAFYSAEAAYVTGPIMAGIGYEVLGGDDARGFQTPLATLHKFQGFADKFLITPAAGVKDAYAKASYTFGDVGPLKGVKVVGFYHDFSSDTGSVDYGSEVDLVASAKWNGLSLLAKYADYSADEFSTDTQKLWLQVGYGF